MQETGRDESALTAAERAELLEQLRSVPERLEAVVAGLDDEALFTAWLPDEWTVAQNVHHVADGHLNAFSRMKMVLCADRPRLEPYDQDVWARTPDASTAPVAWSLELIRGVHARWHALLVDLPEEAWSRDALHGEMGPITLDSLLAYYARHGDVHVAQIEETLAARG